MSERRERRRLHAPAASVGEAIRIFATGRIAWLFFGLAFQLLTVRIMALEDYIAFTTASAAALLLQWFLLLGIPRLISRYGGTLVAANDGMALKQLLRRLLLARGASLLVTLLVSSVAAIVVANTKTMSSSLLMTTVAWSIGLTLFSDVEAAGQVLMQQRLARIVAWCEPAIRTAGLVAFAVFIPEVTAWQVIAWSATTTLLSVAALGAGIAGWYRHAGAALAPATLPPVRAMIRMAVAGQSSSFGALLVSPSAVRLVAAWALPSVGYAAFAFIQGLVVSAIRFTPSLLLTALIEPLVMTDLARSRSPKRLEAALGLVFKIELLFWSATVAGLIAAGPAILGILSGGRFQSFDLLLPALLPILLCYGLYRSFETAAFAVGAARSLNGSLVVGAIGLVVLLFAAKPWGLAAIVVIPYLEVIGRLLLVGVALGRADAGRIFDGRALGIAIVVVLASGFGLRAAAANGGNAVMILAGVAAGTLALSCIALMRPLRTAEADLVPPSRLGSAVLRRLTRASQSAEP